MFERFLHQTPFFRILVPFILGIIFQIKFNILTNLNLYILTASFILTLLLIVFRLTQNFVFNKVWGIIISLLLFSVGVQLVIINSEKEVFFDGSNPTFIATITEEPEAKENSIKTVLQLNYIKDSTQWETRNSLLLCYFQIDSATKNIHLGDQIIAQTFINEIKHSGNPYAFNYKKYLKYKEIYNQCYIKANQYKVIAHNQGQRVKLLSNKIRQQLLTIYKRNNINENEFAVLSALTLGYKKELTPELKESFSTSGAMHILAVSGLHVGIIYIILCKLLFFFRKTKYGKILHSIIIIAILFFYALLTGLSDSVLRATVMFTFISIGNMFTRQVNIYNSIAASAFILLFLNPYSIMSVGFQLSYTAVISIVFFQPKIYSLLNFNRKITDYIWQLISVAIAAQIGTFPITVHYFNQFPLYFIFTNIIIIPLATLIIYSALILFIFSFSEILSSFLAHIINMLTHTLNQSIGFIDKLPNSSIQPILIDSKEVFLLLTFILFISFFIIDKKYKYLQLSFLILLLLGIYNITMEEINSHKSIVTVHYVSGRSAFQFIENKKAYLFYDNEVNFNDKFIKYNINPIWEKLKIDTTKVIAKQLVKPINYFSFKNKRFIQLRINYLTNFTPRQKIKTDYLILSEDINISIAEIKRYFNFKTIIFDTSNSYYVVKNWEKECIQSNTDYYNVLDNGAFIHYL